MKKNLSTTALVVIFLVGLSVLLYPSVSNYWNSRVQSRAVANYEDVLQNMKPEDYTEMFQQADGYNARLRETTYPLLNYKDVAGYEDILDVSGTGIMGYIDIDKIKVELPIYHGTSDAVLNVAIGHLEGTSLPVGGESTHAVVSGHRGLPSAKLFTELDKLEVGDTFNITILDRVLTYEIDQILIVDPDDTEPIEVVEGEDYCTLLTCTPYGINTHRLLVRGTRVETVGGKSHIFVPNDATRIDPLVVTPAVAMPMLLVALVVVMVKYRKK